MCLSQCFPLILQYLSRRQREKNELPRYPQCLHVPGNKPRPFQATSLSPKMKALFSLLFTQETVSEELNVFQAKEQAAEELAEPQEQCTLRLPRGEVLKLSAISPAPSFTSLVTLVTLPGCTYELEMANPTPPFFSFKYFTDTLVLYSNILFKDVDPKETTNICFSRKDSRGHRESVG